MELNPANLSARNKIRFLYIMPYIVHGFWYKNFHTSVLVSVEDFRPTVLVQLRSGEITCTSTSCRCQPHCSNIVSVRCGYLCQYEWQVLAPLFQYSQGELWLPVVVSVAGFSHAVLVRQGQVWLPVLVSVSGFSPTVHEQLRSGVATLLVLAISIYYVYRMCTVTV